MNRLDELEPLAFWQEPVDTLSQGVEFVKGARTFIENTLNKFDQSKLENLCLALRAYVGFAVKSGTSDALIDALELLQKVEESVSAEDAKKINDALAIHLKNALQVVQD